MTTKDKVLTFFTFKKRQSASDTYSVRVISLPEELDEKDTLPSELAYIEAKNQKLFQEVRKILKGGKAIGIRTVEVTPKTLLHAVNEISVRSQGRMILTWLPHLLWSQEEPVITEKDRRCARKEKVDLDECVAIILKNRFAFKRFVLIDEVNEGTTRAEMDLIEKLNEEIYPLTIHYIVERVVADNAHERTAMAQAIIKALIVIGPVTHALEAVSHGIGKIFAASTDDVMAEVAELFALRGSGFTWRELMRRLKILGPVLALATYGAFQVEGFVERNELFVGGIIFGLSAVALSLTTAIVSISMYKDNVEQLIKEKKHRPTPKRDVWKIALIQDFTNPARLGLLIGGLASPLIAGATFVFLPTLVHNGWVLAMLGTMETLIAGLTVLIARNVEEWRLKRELRGATEAIRHKKKWAPAEPYTLVVQK